MPMIDGLRVDKQIKDLCDVLITAGAVITKHEGRLKVTNPDGDRCTMLPTRYQGRSQLQDINKHLRSIGLGADRFGEDDGAVVVRDANGAIHVRPMLGRMPAILGFEFSDTTSALMEGLLDGLAADIAAEYSKRLAAESENTQWQELAQQAEAEASRVKHERDTAVADLVRQRDEYHERAKKAETELATIRRSLAGLREVL